MTGFNFTREDVMGACLSVLAYRRIAIERELDAITDSVDTETKSSAGDKHETARARMQAEQGRLYSQLLETKAQETELEKVKRMKPEQRVSLGSLVFTDSGVFFVAIALGKLQLGHHFMQVISVRSPIALKMLGLKNGDEFEMNGIRYSIKNIS
jgi:transcription elongation GreA/GreB family factor